MLIGMQCYSVIFISNCDDSQHGSLILYFYAVQHNMLNFINEEPHQDLRTTLNGSFT